MSSILVKQTSNGARRCDSVCHQAKDSACSCICKGRYHGVGNSTLAIEQLLEDAKAGKLELAEESMLTKKLARQVRRAKEPVWTEARL